MPDQNVIGISVEIEGCSCPPLGFTRFTMGCPEGEECYKLRESGQWEHDLLGGIHQLCARRPKPKRVAFVSWVEGAEFSYSRTHLEGFPGKCRVRVTVEEVREDA